MGWTFWRMYFLVVLTVESCPQQIPATWGAVVQGGGENSRTRTNAFQS